MRLATSTFLGMALLSALGAQPLLLHAARAAEPAAATQAPATAAQLRVDGLYYARDPQTSGNVFLRFHPDGQVPPVEPNVNAWSTRSFETA